MPILYLSRTLGQRQCRLLGFKARICIRFGLNFAHNVYSSCRAYLLVNGWDDITVLQNEDEIRKENKEKKLKLVARRWTQKKESKEKRLWKAHKKFKTTEKKNTLLLNKEVFELAHGSVGWSAVSLFLWSQGPASCKTSQARARLLTITFDQYCLLP